jgi:hypothetical protein
MADLGGGGVKLLAVAATDRYLRAFDGKGESDSASDAATSSAYDGYLALQTHDRILKESGDRVIGTSKRMPAALPPDRRDYSSQGTAILLPSRVTPCRLHSLLS